jgi:hypothetical protein
MQTSHKPQAAGRSWKVLASTALVPLFFLNGCQSMSNTDKGVLGGAGLGAVTGGLVGAATGHAGAGAAIGAGLGGVAGGLTGAAIDNSERKQAIREAAAQNPPVSLTDIVQMTQKGSSDSVIIEQIRVTGSVYHLSSQEIMWLQDNGVREPVIREMQATAYRPARRVYTAAPVVQPVYVVEEPPPIGVGVGFSYTHVGRRW